MLIGLASSPNDKISIVSFGNLVLMYSTNAIATFLAGVILSSP